MSIFPRSEAGLEYKLPSTITCANVHSKSIKPVLDTATTTGILIGNYIYHMSIL